MIEKPEEKHTVPSPVKKTLKEKRVFGLLGGIFMILGAVGDMTCGRSWAPFMGGATPARVAVALESIWKVPIDANYIGALVIIFAIIEIIGAVFAIQGKHWLFALIAAIINLNTLGIIFVAVGRKEFK